MIFEFFGFASYKKVDGREKRLHIWRDEEKRPWVSMDDALAALTLDKVVGDILTFGEKIKISEPAFGFLYIVSPRGIEKLKRSYRCPEYEKENFSSFFREVILPATEKDVGGQPVIF